MFFRFYVLLRIALAFFAICAAIGFGVSVVVRWAILDLPALGQFMWTLVCMFLATAFLPSPDEVKQAAGESENKDE